MAEKEDRSSATRVKEASGGSGGSGAETTASRSRGKTNGGGSGSGGRSNSDSEPRKSSIKPMEERKKKETKEVLTGGREATPTAAD